MHSYMSIGFIFLAIGGLLGEEFCFDLYCYRTDGQLKNITSLKEAQDYCYNNDSSSWLLEIYGYKSFIFLVSQGFTNPIICNSVGTVAKVYTSVTNSQLPTGITVDETFGQDFVAIAALRGNLGFYAASKIYPGYRICRVPGTCAGGYCYEITEVSLNWFKSEIACFTNITKGDKDLGHLATFDGMTYNEISNLSFVSQLQPNMLYWIGYSKLVYTLQHSNIRNYILTFDNPYPLLTAAPAPVSMSYFVYMEFPSNKEQAVGSGQFQIICMKYNTTTMETSTITSSATTGRTPTPISESTIILSLVLPVLLWLLFVILVIWCIIPFCVNRKIKKRATNP